MVLEQLAAAEASLTEDDKEFGAALVDVGAETTGLIIYQRGAVQHTAVFPLADRISRTTSPSVCARRYPKQRRSRGRSAARAVVR